MVNFRAERTKDFFLVESILLEESIRPHLFSKAGDRIDFTSPVFNNVKFYLGLVDDEPAGAFLFMEMIQGLYIVDAAILPQWRGFNGFKIGKLVFDLFFNENEADFLLAKIDITNRRSKYYAIKTGFSVIFSTDNFYYMGRSK